MRGRQLIGATGAALVGFGAFRIVTEVAFSDQIVLIGWLIGAVLIHDGVLSPLVIGVGTVLARIPPRARRYLQTALITGALVTVVAVPLILREDTQPPSKALLLQNYGVNLSVLLAIIAAASLAGYAISVAATRRR